MNFPIFLEVPVHFARARAGACTFRERARSACTFCAVPVHCISRGDCTFSFDFCAYVQKIFRAARV